MKTKEMSVEELLNAGKVPVYTDRHFVYTSDEHGEAYANLRSLAAEENLPILRELSYRLIAHAIEAAKLDLSQQIVVVGPETLGAMIAEEGVAIFNLRTLHGTPRLRAGNFIHDPADKKKFLWGEGGESAIIASGAQIIWIDDLLNQGSTLKRTRHLVEDFWPDSIKVVATIVDRSHESAESLEVPILVNLVKLSLQSYSANQCPFCAEKRPMILHPGHGWKFQESNPDYIGGFYSLEAIP